MSVLIKDMKMPKSCLECPFEDSPEFVSCCIAKDYKIIGKWKDLGEHKPDWCPLEEPKTGEWIEVEVFPEVYDIEGVKTWGSKMQCDQCGFRFMAIEGHITQYNFCPNCGADMRGEEE